MDVKRERWRSGACRRSLEVADVLTEKEQDHGDVGRVGGWEALPPHTDPLSSKGILRALAKNPCRSGVCLLPGSPSGCPSSVGQWAAPDLI